MRRGPEELPASLPLLAITILAQGLVALALEAILPDLPATPGLEEHGLALLAIETTVPLLWGWVILQLVRRTERFLQMMTAVFGCQLVLLPLVVPAVWANQYFDEKSGLAAVALMAQAILSIWLTVATARIVRAATDWPMVASVLTVIIQGLATLLILLALFPDLAEAFKQGS